MTRPSPSLISCLAVLAMLVAGGCDRVLKVLEVSGTVAPLEPQLIGPERLSVTLPKSGAQATLGPVARNGDVTVWQTLDGITLSFRNGLLIGTRGMGDDLMSADVAGTLAMLREPATDLYHLHTRSYLDGEDRTVFRRYQCRETERADAQVDLVGRIEPVLRSTVRCVSPSDEITNVYWIDGSGQVLRSRQWVSPAVGYMETLLSPAAVSVRVGAGRD